LFTQHPVPPATGVRESIVPVPVALSDRYPVVDPTQLVATFVPPPRFGDVRFGTYWPDPQFPTQSAAVQAAATFAGRQPPPRRRFFRPAPPEERPGIYFDGGFGVGKTHLLASVWHASDGPKVFGTFVEYTNLVGALGFATAVEQLSEQALVCVDEFELDDPGDTVLMSTLLSRLTEADVRVAATSNTLPDRLGEGRFAADDFLREIQALSAQFDVIRVDGDDYRHRGLPTAPPPESDEAVAAAARVAARRAGARSVSLDDFDRLIGHLAEVHPSSYGAMVDDIQAVHVTGVRTLSDQAQALRLVVLIDRLYDRDIPVVASGVAADQVFAADLLKGGYRKKYYRSISRLVALTREAAGESVRGES
jgi:cell division protein ZapE